MNQHPSSPGTFSLPTLRLDRRRLTILVGLSILTIVFLLVLGGGQAAIAALTAVDPAWLVLGLVVHYSGFAVRGLRWQQLLQALNHRLSWRSAMTLLLSGWFVSALLPARAGDLLRIAILRTPTPGRAAVPVADGLGSIVMERVLDMVALVVLGAGVGFALLRTAMPGWVVAAYGSALLLLTIAAVALLLAPSLLQWLRRRSPQPLWQKALDLATQLMQSLQSLGRAPALALLVLVESLYIWLCDGVLLWAVLQAMGVDAPLPSIIFVALTVDIFAAIPLTPGGIGQIEGVNVALLALLPLPAFNLSAAVLLNRAISYWSFLLFSGIVTFAAGIGQMMVGGRASASLEKESDGDNEQIL
ncbi:MAG: lysylphosphatidylglycerol synthase transmembrane domain-containing protein [Caldilineaceae bacterium]